METMRLLGFRFTNDSETAHISGVHFNQFCQIKIIEIDTFDCTI